MPEPEYKQSCSKFSEGDSTPLSFPRAVPSHDRSVFLRFHPHVEVLAEEEGGLEGSSQRESGSHRSWDLRQCKRAPLKESTPLNFLLYTHGAAYLLHRFPFFPQEDVIWRKVFHSDQSLPISLIDFVECSSSFSSAKKHSFLGANSSNFDDFAIIKLFFLMFLEIPNLFVFCLDSEAKFVEKLFWTIFNDIFFFEKLPIFCRLWWFSQNFVDFQHIFSWSANKKYFWVEICRFFFCKICNYQTLLMFSTILGR